MTGAGELSSRVFLIDFGLAQLFRNPSTRRHVPLVSGLKTVGTIIFTSINSHSGRTQSCQDDLESLVYSIVYLCRGRLPWQNIVKGSVEKYAASVLEKKIASSKTLCQGLPAPFVAFTQHIQSLGFDERPQYDKLHTLLMQCLARDSNGVVSNPITVSPLPGKPGNSLPRSGRIEYVLRSLLCVLALDMYLACCTLLLYFLYSIVLRGCVPYPYRTGQTGPYYGHGTVPFELKTTHQMDGGGDGHHPSKTVTV
ncbi:kinase-like domain-containing protein [Lactarius sanguifluus]|nr:kinase-like domain-containing protein [Lactarius sanguifluus]